MFASIFDDFVFAFVFFSIECPEEFQSLLFGLNRDVWQF